MPARILVIEDNPESLELMTYLLQSFGHATLTAVDGEAGLMLAGNEKPDLVVCDIQLPGLDGDAVARAVKADRSLKDTVLVAVTALAMVGDREQMLAAGFHGYIPKPIDPETFVAQVEDLLPPALRSKRPGSSASSVSGAAPTVDPIRTTG